MLLVPHIYGKARGTAATCNGGASTGYNGGMSTHPAPDAPALDHPTPGLTDEDVRTCMRVLRLIEADRSHLTFLTQEQRRELLMLAGLVTKPERHDVSRMLKGFRRAKRKISQEHDRNIIERAGLRMQRRSKVYAPLWLERPKPEVESACRRIPSGAQLLCLQAVLRENASILRLDVRTLRRIQLRQTRTDGRSRRPLRAHYRRARQDRLSGILEAAARRRACHRHHPLPSRCHRSVLEGARLRRFSRAPGNSWTRSTAYAERRVVHAVLVGTVAAAGLPSEQCLPDRAPAGRILRAPARARERAARRAARCVARAAREPR